MIRWFAFLIAGSTIASLTGCNSMSSAASTSKRDCCRLITASNFIADHSVYDLEATWETDAGQHQSLKDLAGRPQIVALIYASCHVTCPITLQSMKQLEASLPRNVRSQVGFVLVTLDPASDSTATLRSFRRSQQLSSRWFLLRGSSVATQKFANSLGVAFVRDNFRLAHSAQITLLDATGKIMFRHTDLHASLTELAKAVEATVPQQAAVVR